VEIKYYTTRRGKSPVTEYINRLPRNEKTQVLEMFQLLIGFGLKAPVSMRKIDGKLWKLKPGKNRIFYVMLNKDIMVLLHAYRKKSQKAPENEISTARKRMNEIL